MAMPIGIDVEQYKRLAKELLKSARLGEASAIERAREHHPEQQGLLSAMSEFRLADAQLVVAREYGFASWPRFVEYLHFRNAVAALDAGDISRLKMIIDAHPRVLSYECRTGEWYESGYFAGATLLMHVAGNPARAPLPANIVSIAALLIERHLTPEIARDTIELILTSRQASEAGVALPLIDLLSAGGGHFDVDAPDVLVAPLLNHAPGTAEALIRRGATMNLRDAAALGELEAMRRALGQATSQEDLDIALIFASIRGERDAAALLVERGARGDMLLSPGGATPRTALHEAANRGHSEIVELLIAAGASAEVLDARWNGNAAGWADAGGFPDLARRLREPTP